MTGEQREQGNKGNRETRGTRGNRRTGETRGNRGTRGTGNKGERRNKREQGEQGNNNGVSSLDATSVIACVASVSVWFQSKERQRNRTFGFGRPRNSSLPLTLVPRFLLRNRTETLATQATSAMVVVLQTSPYPM